MTSAHETIAAVIEQLEREGYVLCKREPVARLLNWVAPKHIPIPHQGICARSFAEFHKGAGENGGYWKEGAPLYAAAPPIVKRALYGEKGEG